MKPQTRKRLWNCPQACSKEQIPKGATGKGKQAKGGPRRGAGAETGRGVAKRQCGSCDVPEVLPDAEMSRAPDAGVADRILSCGNPSHPRETPEPYSEGEPSPHREFRSHTLNGPSAL